MKRCTFFIHVLRAAIVMNLTIHVTRMKKFYSAFLIHFFAKSYFLFEHIISLETSYIL